MESRFVRLGRDAASYRGDRYPERQRAERAGDAWCRDNEPHLRAAVWSLACLNDAWPRLAPAAPAERLLSWHRELEGPDLAARLKSLRPILVSHGAEPPASTEAVAARNEVLALLEELLTARHGADSAG
ncbi:hypothetical protein ACWGJ2_19745 [Streptomyces sp. NPDC054796]